MKVFAALAFFLALWILVAPAPTSSPKETLKTAAEKVLKDVEEPIAKQTHQALTVETLDGYIGLLKMFKDMLPLDLVTTMDNVSYLKRVRITKLRISTFSAQRDSKRRSCKLPL